MRCSWFKYVRIVCTVFLYCHHMFYISHMFRQYWLNQTLIKRLNRRQTVDVEICRYKFVLFIHSIIWFLHSKESCINTSTQSNPFRKLLALKRHPQNHILPPCFRLLIPQTHFYVFKILLRGFLFSKNIFFLLINICLLLIHY